jgi:hypothetical protein
MEKRKSLLMLRCSIHYRIFYCWNLTMQMQIYFDYQMADWRGNVGRVCIASRRICGVVGNG